MAVHPPAIQHEPHYRAQPEADQIPGQVVIQDSPEPEQIVRDRQAGDRDDEAGKARENELDPLTGAVILTSTDVIAKCRVLVDQGPPEADDPRQPQGAAVDQRDPPAPLRVAERRGVGGDAQQVAGRRS